MKAFYDDEADVLEIHLTDPIRGGYTEDLVDVEDMCWVEIDDDGDKVGVELHGFEKYIHLLDAAAEQYELDADSLKAAAGAAKAAPMRLIAVEIVPEELVEVGAAAAKAA